MAHPPHPFPIESAPNLTFLKRVQLPIRFIRFPIRCQISGQTHTTRVVYKQ
jgi:hypothetical protein